jgi:hypothetical protein
VFREYFSDSILNYAKHARELFAIALIKSLLDERFQIQFFTNENRGNGGRQLEFVDVEGNVHDAYELYGRNVVFMDNGLLLPFSELQKYTRLDLAATLQQQVGSFTYINLHITTITNIKYINHICQSPISNHDQQPT